jgi:small-conductance mechanosensitive channel
MKSKYFTEKEQIELRVDDIERNIRASESYLRGALAMLKALRVQIEELKSK